MFFRKIYKFAGEKCIAMKRGIHIMLVFFLLVVSCPLPLWPGMQNTRLYQEEVNCAFTNAVCQDADGFVWMGTDYGLYRFDGVDFKCYLHDESDSASLSDNMVRCLYMDRSGRLWVGTANGLQYYCPQSDNFRPVPIHGVSGVGGFVTCITQRRKTGEVWFIASGIGMFRVEGHEAVQVKSSPACLKPYLNVLCEDASGNLWVGTDRAGVYRVGANGRETHFRFATPVREMLQDADGRLLVVGEDTIWVWDEPQDRLSALADGDRRVAYRSAVPARDGSVFVGTDGQGLKFIPKGSLEVRAKEGVLHPSLQVGQTSISSVLEDRSGNLWMACLGQGILMLPKKPALFSFWDFSSLQAGRLGGIVALCKDSDGGVWCSLGSRGLFHLDASGEVVGHIKTKFPVSALYEDSGGRLWAGVEHGGLFEVDKRHLALRERLPLPDKDYLDYITGDGCGNLYLGLLGTGILQFHVPTGARRMFVSEDSKGGMANNWVTTMLCDSKQRLWIGHFGGLSCYDIRQGRFLPLGECARLGKGACYRLLEGRGGDIWIGTSRGLFRYVPESGRLSRWTTLQGLSDNSVCGLAEDDAGNIWCSTMKGINELRVKEGEVVSYYAGNGLEDKAYLRGLCCQGKDGMVYFGGYRGGTLFDPDEVGRDSFEGEVHITGMSVQGHPVTQETSSGGKPVLSGSLFETRKIVLSYLDNSFTFAFSTMDFREAGNIVYEYRLSGSGEDWNRTASGVNKIHFNHLPPGRYTLQVRACENGVHSPVKDIAIHIVPPWYWSVWAKFFYGVLSLGGLVLLCLMWKKRQEEKANEGKLDFFMNISHEIRTPMTLVLGPLEALLKKENSPEKRRLIGIMYRNTNRVLALLGQLLDIRMVDKGQMRLAYSRTEMVGFVRELLDAFEYQAKAHGICLKLVPGQKEQFAWIDRGNFDKVLVNLLSNAFKHTPRGGEIEVDVSSGIDKRSHGPLRNYVEIAVKDSGTGIEEKQLARIFDLFYQGAYGLSARPIGFGIGLNLCKSLVRLHYGTITAANCAGAQGCCFTVRIPAGNGHLRDEKIVRDTVGGERNACLCVCPTDGEGVSKDAASPRPASPSCKVLLVDDDEELCSFLRAQLSLRYKVFWSTNGGDALRMAVTECPDVIVSDVMMPGMDGFTLTKKLKFNVNTNHIPVILLTSKNELADRIESWGYGADGYMAKPFSLEELETLMDNVMKNRILLKGKFSGMQGQDGKIRQVELKNADAELMEKVVDFVNRNMGNPDLNIDMLVKEVGMSRVQLYRKMKGLTGMSVSSFIRNIRLRQAAELLKRQNCGVSQVAYAVGFANPTHFSTCFKDMFGVSPKEYIRQNESPHSANP